ncbi:hypothetical protein MAPG_05265 [Magnaporthiopsis poae ATCC 64411]|uniref:Uncharacterized protein n=1 Tax=Magnaporthiopsis poae (strain ATCC 64411 / 73-15) TaxID=644358 RepID=A0A0C4DYY0_MAGP6|nr:hypothetical protein MAPG_05265 [Magnaporthiopsis poae ATCC 64411]
MAENKGVVQTLQGLAISEAASLAWGSLPAKCRRILPLAPAPSFSNRGQGDAGTTKTGLAGGSPTPGFIPATKRGFEIFEAAFPNSELPPAKYRRIMPTTPLAASVNNHGQEGAFTVELGLAAMGGGSSTAIATPAAGPTSAPPPPPPQTQALAAPGDRNVPTPTSTEDFQALAARLSALLSASGGSPSHADMQLMTDIAEQLVVYGHGRREAHGVAREAIRRRIDDDATPSDELEWLLDAFHGLPVLQYGDDNLGMGSADDCTRYLKWLEGLLDELEARSMFGDFVDDAGGGGCAGRGPVRVDGGGYGDFYEI